MDAFGQSMIIAASGMRSQGVRLRVIAENIANADSTGETPNDLPYRRQVVTFKNAMDNAAGVDTVQVRKVDVDTSDFKREFHPGHPAADKDGYVMLPNVDSLIEMNDLREAQRSYQANMNVIEMSRQMLTRTIGLLRS
jgi:flagellar basal-body rod protein FlgC